MVIPKIPHLRRLVSWGQVSTQGCLPIPGKERLLWLALCSSIALTCTLLPANHPLVNMVMESSGAFGVVPNMTQHPKLSGGCWQKKRRFAGSSGRARRESS